MKTMFTIDRYDRDGDVVEKGIYFTLINADDFSYEFRVCTIDQVTELIEQLKSCKKEIVENYDHQP